MQTLDIRALMDKLDDWTRDAFEAACRLCVARDHLEVEVEHYLLSLLEQPSSGAESLLQHLGVDCLHLIEQLGMTLSRLTPARKATPGVSPRLRVLLRDSWTLASLNFGADRIATGHV